MTELLLRRFVRDHENTADPVVREGYGALSGAVMLAGFRQSDGNLEDPSTKAKTYQYTKQMVQAFQSKAGSTSCKELKGIETGKVLHSCPDCIMDCVEIVQEVLGL